jgi:hypothetical protein
MQTTTETSELLPIVARLQGRKIGVIDGSPVFSVPPGWPAQHLRAEPGIVTAETPSAFDAAVKDPEAHTIFIPRDTFGWNLMERILRRNSLSKTIFWEE